MLFADQDSTGRPEALQHGWVGEICDPLGGGVRDANYNLTRRAIAVLQPFSQ
jgi:hypothetical protein